jgi:hypothetical protein
MIYWMQKSSSWFISQKNGGANLAPPFFCQINNTHYLCFIFHLKQNNVMSELILSEDYLATTIYKIRGQKVILDRDIARLYDIPTKVLKRAVKRHLDRFPTDFMFELSEEEFDNWRSQFVTSNADKMGLRYAPMAFTEQGVAMLSSVINSTRAIEVNIAIMRTFVRMRQWVLDNQELSNRLQTFEAKLEDHESAIETLFDTLDNLSSEKEEAPRLLIGFNRKDVE